MQAREEVGGGAATVVQWFTQGDAYLRQLCVAMPFEGTDRTFTKAASCVVTSDLWSPLYPCTVVRGFAEHFLGSHLAVPRVSFIQKVLCERVLGVLMKRLIVASVLACCVRLELLTSHRNAIAIENH